MSRVDFFASVKKVTSTQRIDQRGAIGKRVQLVLEVDLEGDDPHIGGELLALQDAVFVRVGAETAETPAAEAPADGDLLT